MGRCGRVGVLGVLPLSCRPAVYAKRATLFWMALCLFCSLFMLTPQPPALADLVCDRRRCFPSPLRSSPNFPDQNCTGAVCGSGLYGVPDIYVERSRWNIAVLPCFHGSRNVPAVWCDLPDAGYLYSKYKTFTMLLPGSMAPRAAPVHTALGI